MIPGVGTNFGDDHDDRLSNLPEESEESDDGGHRNSNVGLLDAINIERSDTDDDIANAVNEIERHIPTSELGDDNEDSNNTNPSIPSVVFMIPFPAPVNGKRSKSTSPFMLYTPPRAHYTKPVKDEVGKAPREKFLKKLVRRYQKEVSFGEEMKRQEIKKEGSFQVFHKIRGCCIRGASMMTKWLPNPCVETLARLPPKRKLGEVTVLFPSHAGRPRPEGEDQPYEPTEEELRHDISVLLRRTRKRIVFRLIGAGAFMPIAIGADIFAPVFLVEITLAYLAFQVYGFRKIKALTSPPKAKKVKKSKKNKKLSGGNALPQGTSASGEIVNTTAGVAGESVEQDSTSVAVQFRITRGDQAIFDPLLPLMYNICSRIDPLTFPPQEEEAVVLTGSQAEDPSQNATGQRPKPKGTQLPRTLHKPGPEIVRELVAAFRANLPEDVQARHNLNEERVSEDLARCMKKAAVEYVWSLKGRPERSPLKITQKWVAKRKTVRQERKQKRKIKNQIKKELMEDLQAVSSEDQLSTTPENQLAIDPEHQPSTATVPVEPQAAIELPAVFTKVESKQEKKARLAKEKKEANEVKQKAKIEAREKEKLAKLAIQEARKGKKKAE
ncbi:hypothetical protein CROQUDRAFT_41786 [Cronartium quercuum f. sp. fusiforme G11]|uniref:Uncharacterized protein n=1 Tax=Cronartium quercuum f. sp. fusiforme G11 TaxID=708437 RepID=A0A9P6NL97_9BASI|nr:hypothetical protein CROQUDRAFT_41786 [Cronartium quercuum f. sp. fusiforme G11]